MRMIDINDGRLTTKERALLRNISDRLHSDTRQRIEQLPPAYKSALDEVYGECAGDGDLTKRGKR